MDSAFNSYRVACEMSGHWQSLGADDFADDFASWQRAWANLPRRDVWAYLAHSNGPFRW